MLLYRIIYALSSTWKRDYPQIYKCGIHIPFPLVPTPKTNQMIMGWYRMVSFAITIISCGQHPNYCEWQLDLSTELRKLTSTASLSSCRRSCSERRRTFYPPTSHSVCFVFITVSFTSQIAILQRYLLYNVSNTRHFFEYIWRSTTEVIKEKNKLKVYLSLFRYTVYAHKSVTGLATFQHALYTISSTHVLLLTRNTSFKVASTTLVTFFLLWPWILTFVIDLQS